MPKVFWTPYQEKKDALPTAGDGINLLFSEPTSLLKHITSTRYFDPKFNTYIKCPSFLEYCKNVYVVTAPFDIEFLVDRDRKWLQTNLTTTIYNTFVINRGDIIGPNDPYILTMPPKYLFYSTDPVKIEVMPCLLNTSRSIDNINIIPGSYDIDKWIRPLDFTFELKDDKQPIAIKQGDALFCIRFITDDNEKVELERTLLTDDLLLAAMASTGVKLLSNAPHSLKKLYTMAEGFLNVLPFRKKKKCPFNFKK